MQAAPAGENPYGLVPALQQGGIIAWSVVIILVGMAIFSFLDEVARHAMMAS